MTSSESAGTRQRPQQAVARWLMSASPKSAPISKEILASIHDLEIPNNVWRRCYYRFAKPENPHRKPFRRALAVSTFILLGAAAGCILSDYAAAFGFPDQRYLVELKHEQAAARATYVCTRTGAALGDNLSNFDLQTNQQTNCLLGLTGTVLPDGSFSARTAPFLWRGRLGLTPPIRIDASRIARIEPLNP